MQNKTKPALTGNVSDLANVKPTQAAIFRLNDFKAEEIISALEQSNLLFNVNLLDEMHDKFKCAIDYLAGAETTALEIREIQNNVFTQFYQPFLFYYQLLKSK